ncbi:hypothetical protein BaRGS_00023221, partial [Batillaria attramentaria]
LNLQQCVSNVIEVDETSSSNVVTCRGAGQNEEIAWGYTASSGATVSIATCRPSGSCTITNPLFSATRSPSSTSSQLTFKQDIKTYRSQYGSLTLICDTPSQDEVSCQLDVVHHAEVTSCKAQFNTAGTQRTVNGTCDVSKAYSERGRYSCNWTEHRAGSSTAIPASQTSLTKTAYTEGGATYNSVTCSFNRAFPIVTGTYTYSVIISPGTVTPTVSGSNTIESPVSPSVTCSPSPYVPENQTVTCTCNTQSLGNPEGRLMWFRGNDLINTGNYGDTTLVMTPQPLTRSDHGNTVFRCDAGWSHSQVIRGEQYTASVGSHPSSSTAVYQYLFPGPLCFTQSWLRQPLVLITNLTGQETDIDSPTLTVSPVEVSENMTVTFICRADDARPTPYVILAKRDNGTELTNQSSPLSHSVSRARCEDADVYTCTASNGMGPDMMDDVTLRVKCSPRALFGQSGEHPSVNFKGEPVSLHFNITAYPTPESFNFTFLGSNLTTVTRSPAGIALNASCQQKAGSLYLVICVVIVDYVTSTAAGFYRLTLTNDQGHGDVIFQIKFYSDTSDEGGRNDQLCTCDGGLSTGITVAVSVVVTIVVVVVVFVVWAWRRHWILPCAGEQILYWFDSFK